MRRFEFSEGSSNKFWQIELGDTSFTVTWGKIGTNGQTQTKSFDTAAKAQAEHDKLVKEKVKKGYAEVGAPAVAAAPKPAPKPAPAKPAPAPTPEPAAPKTIVAEGVAWTAEAKREVAPRRGWDVVAPRKADAASAFARIREGVKQVAAALEKGAARAGADTAKMSAARKAFEAKPEEKLDLEAQAAACALFGPRLSWNERPRIEDFIHYWSAVEGASFALRALARSAQILTLAPHGGWPNKVEELAIVTDPQFESAWFRRPDEQAWRALRNTVLIEGDAARAELEREATELRARATPWVRILLAVALERADWAREELDQELANRGQHGVNDAAWPLVLVLPLEEANAYFDRMVAHAWGLLGGFDLIRFDLVASFGAAVAPRMVKALVDGAPAGAEKVRSLAEALALIVNEDVIEFFLARLASKDLRAIANPYLVTHADASVEALAHAAVGRGPGADAARVVLRSIIATRPDAAAKAKLSGASLALVESLVADSAPRAEAERAELPKVLADPPWKKKSSLPAPEVVQGLTVLACEESVEWKPGERESAANETGWMAARPEERKKTLEAIAAANTADVAGRSTWQMPPSTLFAQLPAADAPKAFNEAKLDHFGWGYYGVVEVLVARHGLDVLPGALRFAKTDLAVAAEALRRVKSPRVALLFAEAFARLKKSRDLAGEWLTRFPEVAAIALVPIAVGAPGSARNHAETALRFLATKGHRTIIEDVAKRYGAVGPTKAVLDFDPVQILPKKIAALPAFFTPAAFSRPLLVGRQKALPIDAVESIGTMLSFTSWDDPYAGLLEVKAACDPRSLAEFAWDLFQAWLVSGASSKESWAFLALGIFGDDECARKLTPLVRLWPGEAAHARAVLGLDVLARIGTDVALMHLHGIAQKVKFKGLQEKAREKIDQIAEVRGLSAEELADRLVPDLGLEDDGTLLLDFGPRKFKVVFDESLKPGVIDDAGKRAGDLPKPKQTDDAEAAQKATETWKTLKKDAKAIALGQIMRLELAMCSQRRWSVDVFRPFLLEHPLLVHLVRRLVWGTYDAKGAIVESFRVAEDSSLANAKDDAFELADDATIGIVHRLEMGDERARTWGQIFGDYKILQPFEQLARGVTSMTDRDAKQLDVVKGQKVPTGKVLGLDARGWRRGPPQDAGVVCWYEKHVQGGTTVTLDLEPGIYTGMISESPEQTLGSVSISKGGGGWYAHDKTLPLGDLSPIVYSELVRDLETLRS
jgi:predicted DNA-binding WGR domain protein